MSKLKVKRNLSLRNTNIAHIQTRNYELLKGTGAVEISGQENEQKKMKLDVGLYHPVVELLPKQNYTQNGETPEKTKNALLGPWEVANNASQSLPCFSLLDSSSSSSVSSADSTKTLVGICLLPVIDEYDCQETKLQREKDELEASWWFCPEYIEDIMAYENKKKNRRELHRYCASNKFDISGDGRTLLVDWLVSVQVYTKTINTTLYLAVDLMDTLLRSMFVPAADLQVAAAAAFWVAYKALDGNMKVQYIKKLMDDSVTKKKIFQYEVNVLKASRWLRTDCDVTVFLNYYLFKIFGARYPPEIYYCSYYLIEIMLHSFEYIHLGAADRAASAIYVSLLFFNSHNKFLSISDSPYINHDVVHELYPTLIAQLKIINQNHESYNVFTKYKCKRYFKISCHRQLRSIC